MGYYKKWGDKKMIRKNRKKKAACFIALCLVIVEAGIIQTNFASTVYAMESDDSEIIIEETIAETKPESETQESDKQENIYLGIDNKHVYKNMEQSFSDGYQPKIKDGILYLVIPFTANGSLKNNRLTVDLAFDKEEKSPFILNNYQKEIAKKQYVLKNEIMQKISDNSESAETSNQADQKEIYLYTCQVPLQDEAASGQYTITVKAWGYTEQMEKVILDYQVFVQISGETNGGENNESNSHKNDLSSESGDIEGGSLGESEEAEEELIRQPKLLLESSSLSGKDLVAGVQEPMKITFKNHSDSQTMYNLKVVVSTESPAVQFSKNSFYFQDVAPGGEIKLEGKVKVAINAESGGFPLNFDFEYEDKKGTAATGKETVALEIVQPVRMELEMAEIPGILYASDTVELSLKALNLSRADVYNVRMSLSGSGLFPNEDVFVGNMEAGTEGQGNMQVYVGTRIMKEIGADTGEDDGEKYGPVNGTITLQYEDAKGETHEVVKEFKTEIKKAQILALKVDKEEEANSWWMSVVAVVIAGLVILSILLMLRLRKKNVLLEEARRL